MAILETSDFVHHVLEKVLYEQLGVLVRLEALVHFDLDHFRDLVCDLNLLILKRIYFVANCIVDL